MQEGQAAGKKVVVATGNSHKLVEIRAALAGLGWEFAPIGEFGDFADPVEDGDTFEANARIKAAAAHRETGLAALADDSGLVVDALGGAPGVHSARYAGVHGDDAANNEKLLRELANVPQQERTARFACSIVFIDDDGTETCAIGACEGVIAFEPAGDGGFGYDPLFYPLEYGGKLSMAQLSMEQKNAISHRGKALVALAEKLGVSRGVSRG